VHAAGIEFDHSFFVGKAAEADAIVIRIVFGAFDYAEGSVQRVASTFQENERVVQIVATIISANNNRALAGAEVPGRMGSITLSLRFLGLQTSDYRCGDSGTEKIATACGHEFSGIGNRREE
jgi:hypothetical protein